MSNIFYAARRISQKETEAPTISRESNPESLIILAVVAILIFWVGGKISNWLNKY